MFVVLSTISEPRELKQSEQQESKSLSLEGPPSYPTPEQRKRRIKSSVTTHTQSVSSDIKATFFMHLHICVGEKCSGHSANGFLPSDHSGFLVRNLIMV